MDDFQSLVDQAPKATELEQQSDTGWLSDTNTSTDTGSAEETSSNDPFASLVDAAPAASDLPTSTVKPEETQSRLESLGTWAKDTIDNTFISLDGVPFLKYPAGVTEAIGKMGAGFLAGGNVGVVKGVVGSLVDKDISSYAPEHDWAMKEWMSKDVFQAKGSVGKEVQAWVGDMMSKATTVFAPQADKYRQQAQEAVKRGLWSENQAAFNSAFIDTLSHEWINLIPFVADVGKAKIGEVIGKKLDAIDAAKIREMDLATNTPDFAARMQQGVFAGEMALAARQGDQAVEAYRNNPANPMEFTKEEVPNVGLNITGALSRDEFSEIYKASNPSASTVETLKAFDDYNSKLVKEAYIQSAKADVFKPSSLLELESPEMEAMRLRKMEEGTLADRIFRSQGDNPSYNPAPDLGLDSYSPMTMTRPEFESAYIALEVKGKVRDLQEALDSANERLNNLSGKEALPNANTQRKLAQTQGKIDTLKKQLDTLMEDIKSGYQQARRKREMTIAYKSYLKNRIPWETRPGTEAWKDLYSRAYELRETEAAGLKAFQEETSWQLKEDALQEGRMAQIIRTAMGRPVPEQWHMLDPFAENAIAPIRSADMPINASTMGNTARSSLMPTSIIDGFLKDARKELSLARESEESALLSGPPPEDLGKLEPKQRHKTTENLKNEYGDIYLSSTTKDDFIINVTAGDRNLTPEIAGAIYDKLNGEVKVPKEKAIKSGKTKQPEDMKQLFFPDREKLDKKGWLLSNIIEVLGGKSIRRLRDLQEHSPAMRETANGLWRNEAHLMEDSVNTPSIVQARRQAGGIFFTELGNIYDRLQIALGQHIATGLRNLIPSSVLGLETGGFGLRSISKRVNDALFDALNNHVKPGTHPGIIAAATELRKFLDDSFNYIKSAMPDVEYIKNYVPRFYRWEDIRKNPEPFIELLRKYVTDDDAYIQNFIERIIRGEGGIELPLKDGKIRSQFITERARVTARAHNAEYERKIYSIPYAELKPFIETNLHQVLSRYIHQITTRTEMARKIGVNGEWLDQQIPKIKQELDAAAKQNRDPKLQLTANDVQRIYDQYDALQGTYSRIDSPFVKKYILGLPRALSTWAILHFSTIASLPEAAMPLHHGGIVAYAKAIPPTVTATMNDMARSLISKKIPPTLLNTLVSEMGKAGPLIAAERLGMVMHGGGSTLDALSFTYNLQHAWTKTMHYLSTATFQAMIKDYLKVTDSGKKGLFDAHYRRIDDLMNYYGMPKEEALAWYKDGMKVDHPFYSKFRNGALTFVEDNVLTSNPATRPMWHSIPILAFLHQLKGFPSMMGNTILSRWYWDTAANLHKDLGVATRNSAYTLATTLTATAIGMMSIKINDQMLFGGANPRHMNDNETLVGRAVDRVGFLGPGSSLLDMIQYGGWKGPIATILSPVADTATDVGTMAWTAVAGGMSHLASKAAHKPVGFESQWNASRTANIFEKYMRPINNSIFKMGAGVNPDSRQQIREMYKQWLMKWFGMHNPDFEPSTPTRPRG